MTRIVTEVHRAAHGSIEALGGPAPGGTWRLNRGAVAAAIDTGELFLVEEPLGHYVEVHVVVSGGHEHVQTVADGTTVDNLSRLPEEA